jgi:hypothetical protein
VNRDRREHRRDPQHRAERRPSRRARTLSGLRRFDVHLELAHFVAHAIGDEPRRRIGRRERRSSERFARDRGRSRERLGEIDRIGARRHRIARGRAL